MFSDSLEAIQAIRINSEYKGVEEIHIDSIRSILANSLVKGVWHCNRTLNKAAHNMAKVALVSPHLRDWMKDDISRHLLSEAPDV